MFLNTWPLIVFFPFQCNLNGRNFFFFIKKEFPLLPKRMTICLNLNALILKSISWILVIILQSNSAFQYFIFYIYQNVWLLLNDKMSVSRTLFYILVQNMKTCTWSVFSLRDTHSKAPAARFIPVLVIKSLMLLNPLNLMHEKTNVRKTNL